MRRLLEWVLAGAWSDFRLDRIVWTRKVEAIPDPDPWMARSGWMVTRDIIEAIEL